MHHYARHSQPQGLEDEDVPTISPRWVELALTADAEPASTAAKRPWGMWFWLVVFALAIGVGWKFDDETRQISSEALAQQAQIDQWLNRRLVRTVAFSRDGAQLAGATMDGAIYLWDVVSKKLRFTLIAHSTSVLTLAFAPDGRTLASGGGDWPHENGEFLLWDTRTGQLQQRLLDASAPVTCAAFSPDGCTLTACCGYGPIWRWETSHWSLLPSVTQQMQVTSFALAPDGRNLAVATLDHRVQLHDANNGTKHASITNQSYGVPALAFAPDGRSLAVGSIEGNLRIWDCVSLRKRGNMPAECRYEPIRTLSFSPDGRWLAAGGGWWHKPGFVRIWDVAGQEEHAMFHDASNAVYSAAFSPDSKTLATGSDDRIVRLWDIATGTQRTELRADEGSREIPQP